MTEEKQNSEEPVQPPAMGGMLLTMLFMIYIIMNPELRDGMGNAAGAVLGSKITFDYEYPAITFLLAGVRSESGKGRMLLITGLVSSISPIGLGLSSDASISFIASFLMGASQSTFMALTITYVQLATPDQYRGRVSSLYILHAGGIMAFANLGYGKLADTFTAPIVLVITGAVFLLVFSSMGVWDKVLKRTFAGNYQAVP